MFLHDKTPLYIFYRNLERASDGESENRCPFKERHWLAIGRDRIGERCGVREVTAVRHHGRLQIFLYAHGIVGPIHTEWSIDYRHQDLYLESGGHARNLRA